MFEVCISRLLLKAIFTVIVVTASASAALAEFWNLPQEISPANGAVSFEVDSTWHLVQGKAKYFEGTLRLSDPSDYQSVRGEIRLAVAKFDTNGESRDERMREIMNADRFPQVVFTITGFDAPLCEPRRLIEKAPCPSVLFGDLTINGLTRKVKLKTMIEKTGSDFRIKATTSINWDDFNIEDPSILVARLNKTVNIHIEVYLPGQK